MAASKSTNLRDVTYSFRFWLTSHPLERQFAYVGNHKDAQQLVTTKIYADGQSPSQDVLMEGVGMGKRVKVTVRSTHGRTAVVPAIALEEVPGLVAHRLVTDWGDRPGLAKSHWVVTHVATGSVIEPFCFKGPRISLEFIGRIGAIVDWTVGTEEGLRGQDPELIAKLVAAARILGWREGLVARS